jgi:AbrB family looped-hinge helix DNA binding protein
MSKVERQAQKFVGKVVSGGRVTIPKRIREILTIEEGSLIECEIYRFQR